MPIKDSYRHIKKQIKVCSRLFPVLLFFVLLLASCKGKKIEVSRLHRHHPSKLDNQQTQERTAPPSPKQNEANQERQTNSGTDNPTKATQEQNAPPSPKRNEANQERITNSVTDYFCGCLQKIMPGYNAHYFCGILAEITPTNNAHYFC